MISTSTKLLGLTAGLVLAGSAQASPYDWDAEPTHNLDASLWQVQSNLVNTVPYYAIIVLDNEVSLTKNPWQDASLDVASYYQLNFVPVSASTPLTNDFSVSANFWGASLSMKMDGSSANSFFMKLTTTTGDVTFSGKFDGTETHLYTNSPVGNASFTPIPNYEIVEGAMGIRREGSNLIFSLDGSDIFNVAGFTSDITGVNLGLSGDGTGDYGTVTWRNFDIAAVPEPASLAVLTGGAGLLFLRRRRAC